MQEINKKINSLAEEISKDTILTEVINPRELREFLVTGMSDLLNRAILAERDIYLKDNKQDSANGYSPERAITLATAPVRVNKLIKNNLNFVQTTDSGFEEIDSKGTLLRNKDFIEITIDFPTKEKYILRDSIIEIYDYEFNQSQIIEITDDNSFLFDILTNGIEADEINNMNDNSFTVLKNDNQFFINILSERSFSISYNDNMDYKNLIVFEVL